MTSRYDAMFRITTRTNDDEILLKVEGCLMRDWVHELDTCWIAAASDAHGRRIRVDLTDVCQVDAPGRALMTAMYRAGVSFVTKGCLMPEVVREIAESGGRLSENGGRSENGRELSEDGWPRRSRVAAKAGGLQ